MSWRTESGDRRKRESSAPSNRGRPSSSSSSSIGGSSSSPRLGERSGSRPLTKQELKAKEQYEDARGPQIKRLENRIEFSSLSVGEKVRGRVITVKEYGIFVDVGASKDGLVHVKDVSKDYFIQNLGTKFIPGQDVDVWVKFVDEENLKLGLQMFPVVEGEAGSGSGSERSVRGNRGEDRSSSDTHRKPVSQFQVMNEVEGRVTRVSTFGVFIDIGCEVEAFLHRRKMKIPKKKRNFKPWELCPLGSTLTQSLYVHVVDSQRRRIGLTTYHPEEWESMMSPATTGIPSEDDSDGDGEVGNRPFPGMDGGAMVEDDEELGGSTRAANLRALERTLALTLDGDFDEEEDEEEDEEDRGKTRGGRAKKGKEEVLLSSSRGLSRAQILLDDFASESESSQSSIGVDPDELMAEYSSQIQGKGLRSKGLSAQLDSEEEDGGEEISVDDVFDELSAGRNYVTMQDIMRWDYVREIVEGGEIEEDELQVLFEGAGGKAGKGGRLAEEDFYSFVDALADELGLEAEEEDDDDPMDEGGMMDSDRLVGEEDEEVIVVDSDAVPILLIDDSEPSVSSLESESSDMKQTGIAEEQDELDASIESGVEGQSSSLSDHYERKSNSNDLMKYVYGSVAGKKGYVTLDDAYKWDFVEALLSQNTMSSKEVQALFQKSLSENRGKRNDNNDNSNSRSLDIEGFQRFVDELSSFEEKYLKNTDKRKQVADSKSKEKTVRDEEDVSDEISLSNSNKVFKTGTIKVVNSKPIAKAASPSPISDGSYATIEGFIGGDEERGTEEIDEEQLLEETFNALSGGASSIKVSDLLQWNVARELISEGVLTEQTFREFCRQAGERQGRLDIEMFDRLIDLLAPYGTDEDDDDDDEGSLLEGIFDDDDDEEGEVVEEEIIDISTIQRSNSKEIIPVVTGSSGLDKDGEDDEADDEDDQALLMSVFTSLAKGKERVSIKDLLNWDLVLELMGEGVLTEELLREKMLQSGGDIKGVSVECFDRLVDLLVDLYGEVDSEDSVDDESEVGGEEGVDDDDDDVLEVETVELFNEVSGGKGYCSFQDVKNWDLIKQMQEEGIMSDEDLLAVFHNAGITWLKVGEDDRFGLETFEAFLDELSAQTEDFDGEGEEPVEGDE